jgi:hypothetical protein
MPECFVLDSDFWDQCPGVHGLVHVKKSTGFVLVWAFGDQRPGAEIMDKH